MTFLQEPTYEAVAETLDLNRLNSQRSEAYHLLNLILHPEIPSRWRAVPAFRLWYNHPYQLWVYGSDICLEWQARGYKDTMLDRFHALFDNHINHPDFLYEPDPPDFTSHPKLLTSHRSRLLTAKPEHYGQFGWDVPLHLPFWWPWGQETQTDRA